MIAYFLPQNLDSLSFINTNNVFVDPIIKQFETYKNINEPIYKSNFNSINFENINFNIKSSKIFTYFNYSLLNSHLLLDDSYSFLYTDFSGLLCFKNMVTTIEGKLLLLYTVVGDKIHFLVSEDLLKCKNKWYKKLLRELFSCKPDGIIIKKKFIIFHQNDVKMVSKLIIPPIFNIPKYIEEVFPTTKLIFTESEEINSENNNENYENFEFDSRPF